MKGLAAMRALSLMGAGGQTMCIPDVPLRRHSAAEADQGTVVPLCYGLWKSPAKMDFYLFLFKKKTEMFADSKIFRIFAAIIHYINNNNLNLDLK